MKKDVLNEKLRGYVKSKVTPTERDKSLIVGIYESICNVLGINNCIQIGSYPRYTSIRPIHDLDVLYILGDWDENNHRPTTELNALKSKLEKEYKNPTEYSIEISPQTHSITIVFKDENLKEVFSTDIVPAYKEGINEFQLDMYRVPELIKEKHQNRSKFYEEKRLSNKEMEWIKSDPRGYIEVAKNINNQNDDFRRTVKFVKAWKNFCKSKNDKFKLKSFHIEQIISEYFEGDSSLTMFDGIFKFFINLKSNINRPYILDRADNSKFIDEYILEDDFDSELILQARDRAIVWLENIDSEGIEGLFDEDPFYKSPLSESFVSRDRNIPILISEGLIFKIDGKVENLDGFRKFKGTLSTLLFNIDAGNKVKYDVNEINFEYDYILWKVKNDYEFEPRGEITEGQTKNYPERIAFLGNHYVEAYAIKNDICIAKNKIWVKVVPGQKFH